MSKEEIVELSWQDVIKIANGTDDEGLPRSSAILGLDQIISEKETKKIDECFMELGVIHVYSSGGAATVTIDFPSNQLFAYRKCKKMCEDWLSDTEDESKINQQLSLCVAPYALEGQIFIFFNQLVFADGYENEKRAGRMILTFDNNATVASEVEGINYQKIKHDIEEELRYQEQALKDEVNALIAEEEKLKKQENIVSMEMEQRLNKPLDHTQKEEVDHIPEGVRFTEEEEKIRISEEG